MCRVRFGGRRAGPATTSPWTRGVVVVLIGAALVLAAQLAFGLLAAREIHHLSAGREHLPDLDPFTRFELPTIGRVYDASGQLLTRTLMDYALPRADEVPPIDVASCDSPSPLNPLGVKGTGEGSAVAGPAAIANAVADALGRDGPEITQVPILAIGVCDTG